MASWSGLDLADRPRPSGKQVSGGDSHHRRPPPRLQEEDRPPGRYSDLYSSEGGGPYFRPSPPDRRFSHGYPPPWELIPEVPDSPWALASLGVQDLLRLEEPSNRLGGLCLHRLHNVAVAIEGDLCGSVAMALADDLGVDAG
jgi:hypothetical protein